MATLMKWMDLIALLVATALAVAGVAQPAVTLAGPKGGAPNGKSTQQSQLDSSLARVLRKICTEGRCQDPDGGRALVGVWRDKKGKIGAVVYQAMGGCSHGVRTYHDARGKFLVEAQTGPREPNEWNSSDDRKITALMANLREVETESCRRLKSR